MLCCSPQRRNAATTNAFVVNFQLYFPCSLLCLLPSFLPAFLDNESGPQHHNTTTNPTTSAFVSMCASRLNIRWCGAVCRFGSQLIVDDEVTISTMCCFYCALLWSSSSHIHTECQQTRSYVGPRRSISFVDLEATVGSLSQVFATCTAGSVVGDDWTARTSWLHK